MSKKATKTKSLSGEKEGEKISFEAQLEELEKIVRQLEAGEKPLEESIQLFERGEKARKSCLRILDEFEHRIRILKRDSKGHPVLETEEELDEDEESDEDEELDEDEDEESEGEGLFDDE